MIDASLLGTVQSVQGATVSVELSTESLPGLVFIGGYGYRIGQIGTFVRIPLGYVDLFGVVSQVGAAAVPEQIAQTQPFGRRWMTVELVGEGLGATGFQRGLSQYPTFGDKVFLVTEPDLERIYGRKDAPNFVRVGHISSAENIPALVDANRLVTRHSAIVGATGAGKSTTVAGLLMALSDPAHFPSARIMVLDIHGEYGSALADRAQLFRISPRTGTDDQPLFIPYWAMTFDELVALTLGPIDDSSRGIVLQRVYEMKKESIRAQPRDGLDERTVTADSPVPFSIQQLWLDLYNLANATHTVSGVAQTFDNIAYATEGGVEQRGDALGVIPPRYRPPNQTGSDKVLLGQTPLNIRRQLEAMGSKLRDPRFDFMFKPGDWWPQPDNALARDIDDLLATWIGTPKPISILDLSGVPASVLTDLIGVLLRVMFDALFWSRNLSEGGRERPLLVVLEEAHMYLAKGDERPAALAVQRIVKEGRKYGIGAMIVSQRPAEINTTVLSQCGTILAMRLSNTVDRSHVTAAVTDNLSGLLSMLPTLRTGEAIIVGEAVQLPVRTLIDSPPNDRRPDSVDPLVYDDVGPGGWNRDREAPRYAEVVKVWRSQNPTAPELVPQEAVNMDRIGVSSSTIQSVGYDAAASTLEIEFQNGGIYQYFDVPQGVYEGLIGASSVGSYFSQNIRGVYRYARA